MDRPVRPIVTVVLDVAAFGDDPRDRAAALFAAGADWIQLRDRHVPDAELLAAARALVSARDEARKTRAPSDVCPCVIVNKRVDVVALIRADGVHLGFDAVSVQDARTILGTEALIGRSLHSVDEVVAAKKTKGAVDYVHLAPIWNPNSKPATRPALGEERLAEAARAGLPVFAQGGLDPKRAASALDAGAAGVSMTGALSTGAEPAAILHPLLLSLRSADA